MSTPTQEVLALDLAPLRMFLGTDTDKLVDMARETPQQFEMFALTVRQAHDALVVALGLVQEGMKRIDQVCAGIETLRKYENGDDTRH